MPARFDDSPLSCFSGTVIEPNLSHFHPFGSPVYVLQEALQSLHAHNKWTDRARVRIFLCHSPHHVTDIPLILNTQTGLVSPQFHLIYDDDFDTVKRDVKFKSLWQIKARLQTRTQNNQSQDFLPTFSDRHTQNYSPPQADPNVHDMFQVPWMDVEARQQPLPAPAIAARGTDNVPAATYIPELSTGTVKMVARNNPMDTEVEDTASPATRTRSGCVIQRNRRFFDSKVYAFHAFLRTFESTYK